MTFSFLDLLVKLQQNISIYTCHIVLKDVTVCHTSNYKSIPYVGATKLTATPYDRLMSHSDMQV